MELDTAVKIDKRLREIRLGPGREREFIGEYINEFVDGNFVDERFPYIPLSPPKYETARNQYDDFCSAYLISIFMEFLSAKDAEIMLMAYGFLEGFDEKLEERRKKYYEYAHSYNKQLGKKKREDKDNLLREEENKIIKALSNALIETKNEPKKIKKFTNDVYDNFCHNKIPKKIPPPVADYIKSSGIKTENDKTVVKIDFPNGVNVDIEGASESKAFRDLVLDVIKLIVMSILTVTCFIRLCVNVVDYQASENYVGEVHDNNGDYQPDKSADSYQPNADWNPKAIPYDGETNQEPVEEYAETTSTKISLSQFLLLDIDLYLENMDRKGRVEVANLGEDE